MFPSSEHLNGHLHRRPVGPETTTRAISVLGVDGKDPFARALASGRGI